jgi:hypothetical protein
MVYSSPKRSGPPSQGLPTKWIIVNEPGHILANILSRNQGMYIGQLLQPFPWVSMWNGIRLSIFSQPRNLPLSIDDHFNNMPQGKRVSEDLQWAIVRMAPIVNIDILATYTNISPRQIHRILALFRATGQVTRAIDPRRLGRRRQLTPDDIAVCILRIKPWLSNESSTVSTWFAEPYLWWLFGRTQSRAWGDVWYLCFDFFSLESLAAEWIHYEKGMSMSIATSAIQLMLFRAAHKISNWAQCGKACCIHL